MNNFENGEKLIAEAEEYFEEMQRAYERGSWNIVVRRAQEVVELSLKGLLKIMGIEYPKEHDVGGIFEAACKKRKIEVDDQTLSEVKQISSSLAKDRAPAFYMERIYREEQATEARLGAEKVLNLARELFKVLKGDIDGHI